MSVRVAGCGGLLLSANRCEIFDGNRIPGMPEHLLNIDIARSQTCVPVIAVRVSTGSSYCSSQSLYLCSPFSIILYCLVLTGVGFNFPGSSLLAIITNIRVSTPEPAVIQRMQLMRISKSPSMP